MCPSSLDWAGLRASPPFSGAGGPGKDKEVEFKDFPLEDEIKEALYGRGITAPTPIQAAALPLALEGKDLIGQARTGTGKTLAFALPIAQRLEASRQRGRKPRALVLTPTRELALQVASEVAAVAPHLKVVTVYGGTGYGKQKEELQKGADVVVATPGRALDYLRQGVLDLSEVEIAVLDEVDGCSPWALRRRWRPSSPPRPLPARPSSSPPPCPPGPGAWPSAT